MKTRTAIAVLALLLCMLSACNTPGSNATDPMRNGMGFASQGQMAAHQQATLMRAGSIASPARSPRLAGMHVPAFPSFQPFAQ